jgi:casein kinase II subunit alpha
MGDDAQWLCHTCGEPLTAFEIRLYMLKLLLAIDACHSKGVMHRDIKPRNVIINRRRQELRLIDFGLSEFYVPSRAFNVRVCSRFYKPPELLVGYEYYAYAVDIWSAGCMLAGLVFCQEPFIHGADNMDQLSKLSAILGSSSLLEFVDKYKVELHEEHVRAIGSRPKLLLRTFRREDNLHLCDDHAIDLLSKMLTVDHEHRPTARECVQHPFFDAVRSFVGDSRAALA